MAVGPMVPPPTSSADFNDGGGPLRRSLGGFVQVGFGIVEAHFFEPTTAQNHKKGSEAKETQGTANKADDGPNGHGAALGIGSSSVSGTSRGGENGGDNFCSCGSGHSGGNIGRGVGRHCL